MTSHRLRAIIVAVTFTAAGIPSSAVAASSDGYWRLIAQTNNGHCGVTSWDVAISGGRLFYPGGFFMGHPVGLTGQVSRGGRVRVNVMAGPRLATGAGRLGQVRGSGAWSGQGPSGICSGIWTATRLQPRTAFGPSWGAGYAPTSAPSWQSWQMGPSAPMAFGRAPYR